MSGALSESDAEVWRPQLERLLKAALGYVPERLPSNLRRTLHGLADIGGVAVTELLERAASERVLREQIVDAATITHTEFFRHPQHFDFLEAKLRSRAATRIWCAGCATGEEPWSVALAATSIGARVEILATDINGGALARARRGDYPKPRSARMDRVRAPFVVSDALKAMVRFERMGVHEQERIRGLGRFDFVFCRNVLMYFDAERARELASHIGQAVKEDGALLVAPPEALLVAPPSFVHGAPLGVLLPRAAAPKPGPTLPPPPETAAAALEGAARLLGLDPSAAEAALERFVARWPKRAEGWFLLGEALARGRAPERARDAYRRASACARAGGPEYETLARAAERQARKR